MTFPMVLRRHVTLAWQPRRELTRGGVGTCTPHKAGVYKLAVHTQGGRLTVFYAGQSEDLQARLTDHLGPSETNRCLRSMVGQYHCSFAFALVPDARDRVAAERALVLHFRPSCNEAIPAGPDFLVSPLTT